MAPIRIQLAQSKAERQRIYRFRYDVYVREMGKQLACANHCEHMIHEPIDEASALFFAENAGEVVATCRVVYGCDTPVPVEWHERFNLSAFEPHCCESFAVIARLMIGRRFRGSSLTHDILKEAYKVAREKQIQFAFSHCRPQLVPLYQKMGWRLYTESFEDDNAGLQCPLVLVLEDESHLRSVNSMLLSESLNWPNDLDIARWFTDSFAFAPSAIQK